VTYVRLHIFTSVVSFISSIFLPADLSMLLFNYLLFTVLIMLLLCTHCLYIRAPLLFLHTHWVAFWRSWICTSRYWTLYSIDQVLMSSYASRGAWSYPRLDHQYFYFLLFRWFPILYVSVLIIILFHFLFYMLLCVDAFMC